ncbi:hypothetical protein ACN9JG_23120 (plasmid) [Cereibacter azotoformans]|uniref:hypothetical protein n=1 Tax=Cereibacter azotoformans TaxID=43057 RepID=UPI003B22261A
MRFPPIRLLLDGSRTARTIRAIRRGSSDSEELRLLLDRLTTQREQVPDRHLWWILDATEPHVQVSKTDADRSLFSEIHRAALWELQSRYRSV